MDLTQVLGIVVAVAGIVGTPLLLVFRALLKSHEDTIAILTDQNADMRRIVDRLTNVTEGQVESTRDLAKTTSRRRS